MEKHTHTVALPVLFRVERQRLQVATGYPGLAVEVSMDYGKNWRAADGTERIMDTDRVWLRSRSVGGFTSC